MDRGVKIVLAFGVLAGGIGLATLFRRPSPPPVSPGPTSQDRLVLRQQAGAEEAVPMIPDRLTAKIGPHDQTTSPPGTSQPSVARPSGVELGEPPPVLPRSYPPFPEEQTDTPAASASEEPPGDERFAESATTHQIVDGDTLRRLAERYLGDADRYLEIYEANRDLLPSPEVLPIGVELKIPARRSGRVPADRDQQHPLVPVLPPS